MVHGVTKSPNATEAAEHAGSTMGGTDKNQQTNLWQRVGHDGATELN